ncbi:MAG: hypothetical protein A2046_02740 [Bacteroidetes bacterium GWA2_30_7]|nr:MAG: hypothetical protein A2046_02740 [Bacteroidetes bacterium GWA2_30_7]
MNIKDIEIFERFFAKELNSEELQWFNNEINSNPEFAKNFNIIKDINNVLSNKKIRDFRLLLKQAHNENFGKKHKRKIFLYRLSAVAATFLILISTGLYIWVNQNQQFKKDQVFSTYYPDMTNLQGINENADNLFNSATSAYISNDFKKAVGLFSKLADSDSLNSLYKFNLAIAYLGDENYSKSEILLQKLLEENNNLIEDNVQWFLAIVYYKTKQYDKATKLFTLISNNKEHYKAEDALLALKFLEEEKKE